MKLLAVISFSAVMLTAIAAPRAAEFEQQPTEAADPYAIAFRDGQAFADRIEDLRHYYTGKLIRFRLAGLLSAQETAIGIRADQQAAWRAYTNALLALVPDRDTVLHLIGEPQEKPEEMEAFARPQALADTLSAYAARAQTLDKAIADLRATLTPEQLKAARMPRLVNG